MSFNLLRGLNGYKELKLLVLLLNEGRLAKEIKELGIETLILDEGSKSYFDLFLSVNNLLRSFKANIIHTHRPKESLLAFCASKVVKKTRLIRTQHGMPETYNRPFSYKNLLIEFINFTILSHCFDFTVAVSEEMKNNLITKYKCNPKRLHVIHNGTDSYKTITKPKLHDFIIGTCGRLTPVKNFSLFIDIATKVNQAAPEVTFLIAGDGPEIYPLKQKVMNNGLEKVFRFLGQIEDMTNFYNNIDVFLNTSRHEGLPMSIIEAMGNGLPVIAPRVGGISEIITSGKDGYLVDNHDPAIFTEKCLELYNNKKLKERLAQSASKTIRDRFLLNKMIDQYYYLYKLVCS